jgi:hypothetical protein
MLEHYSHIRIDAKRQALDALEAARRTAEGNGNGDEKAKNDGGDPGDRGGQRRPHATVTSQSAVERVSASR